MSNSLCLVVLDGRLGKDPECRYTPAGLAVCTMSVATGRSYKDKQTDEWKEKVAWHTVTVWGKRGEACAQYLAKGQRVKVVGYLEYGKFTNKEGIEVPTCKVVADDVIFDRSGSTVNTPDEVRDEDLEF